MTRVAAAVLFVTLLALAAGGIWSLRGPRSRAEPKTEGGNPGAMWDEPELPTWAKVAPEQIAEAKKHGVPVALENDLGMRFVLIPGGTFLMGSPEDEAERLDDEGPRHGVTLPPFYLAPTETTHAVWGFVMGNHRPETKGAELPATDVSWVDCQTFVRHLNDAAPGGYRLPTEAEWEYACRAGTESRYWSGDTEEDLGRVGWYWANSDRRSHAVGEKPANPWGLHDMHGNVWEWCEDTWHPSYDGAPDNGSAWVVPETRIYGRVARGGSWSLAPRYARSAYRYGSDPGLRTRSRGFRLARSVAP